MKISFYDGHGKLAYNPNTEKNVGVGGTETVIIQAAKALAKKGHDVSVYIKCNFPAIYDKVRYYKYQDYKPSKEDVLFGFENFPPNYNAKKVINWVNRPYTEDVLRYPTVDKIFVVSNWHRDLFASTLPANLVSKMSVIISGVAPYFYDRDVEKQPYNISYSGHPGKGGMTALVPVMERLKLRLPKAELHVYGGGALWGWNNDQYRPIYDKMLHNGVLYHGQVGKLDLSLRLNQAHVFVYPVAEHHKETFCLGVLEAMAAGCVVIASNSGNVRNLVSDKGFIIDGNVNHYSWSMEAVEKIAELFENPSLMEKMSNDAKEYASQFTWEKTADQVERALE